MWIAERDFAFPKLRCRKGDPLPAAWQSAGAARYLKQAYGADCIRNVSGITPAEAPGAQRANAAEIEKGAAMAAPAPAARRGSKAST